MNRINWHKSTIILCMTGLCLAAEPDLQRQQVRGVELHYKIAGKGEPIIFVHGGLVDYREWQPVAATLSNKYRTISGSAAQLIAKKFREDLYFRLLRR